MPPFRTVHSKAAIGLSWAYAILVPAQFIESRESLTLPTASLVFSAHCCLFALSLQRFQHDRSLFSIAYGLFWQTCRGGGSFFNDPELYSHAGNAQFVPRYSLASLPRHFV